MRKLILVLLLPILFISNHSLAADDFDYSRKDFQAVVQMLDMEGHGNDDLATCNVKQLYYKEVAEMMQKGKNKDEILAYYVDQMGEEALKAPLKSGFSLTAWITPFLILIAAALLVYVLIQKWVKKRNSLPTEKIKPSTLDETENEILLSVIEEERKKYF
ncbi:cytochrome c-type biogenesis protein CcmH [Schinkia azotoformans]|uniref:cytochrome c-type biogenesis protein CcmH n=1 Tax=Schinkia azotoformans TaxID=1454 RepID=UPI002DBC1473|nr:cytochrome c-type biogenesis protein CcmH [Schinkia azotoformans]MEC1720259.1 cytochrome c-type biogenesis protein CcmH [Schinkia azotoformans]MED4353681.1 cytochrome c-type biogenesis protein CcmH [Schinkia azotoformans]MED4413262.1 cytochrome c-type biogenesis protein CcmH [Schinkia azotoformans]